MVKTKNNFSFQRFIKIIYIYFYFYDCQKYIFFTHFVGFLWCTLDKFCRTLLRIVNKIKK